MRHLYVHVRRDAAKRVGRLAEQYDTFAPTVLHAERLGDEDWAVVLLNVPNDQVGAFAQALEAEVDDARIVLVPQGVLPLHLPLGDIQRRVHHIVHRSTLELVLGALQSIGTWKGMLLYACFSGLVGAYGVMASLSYLLTAAMLIAPMGAPTMVCAIAVAIGDVRLFGRGALRFFVAVAILVVAAVALGLAYGISTSTAMMEQVTSLSTWTVLLAVVGGAAGAQSQIQSDRDSLVSGTATGFLVAVSLSPTSAVLGLGMVLGRWDYVLAMAFVIVLTFFGIIVGGWLGLLLYGVRPGEAGIGRSSGRVRAVLAACAVVFLAGLVVFQMQWGPSLRKTDLSRQALHLAREALHDVPAARLIETSARFTRPDLSSYPGETMLVEVIVEQTLPAQPSDTVAAAVRRAVTALVRERMDGVAPLVQVSVLPAPR